jgi:hypothetical protein
MADIEIDQSIVDAIDNTLSENTITKQEVIIQQAPQENEIDVLKRELEKEKEEKLNLARKVSEAEQRYYATRNQLGRAEEVAIENAIAASSIEADKIENEIILAQESGKYAEAAKLLRQLTSMQTKIDLLNEKKNQPAQQQVQQQVQQVQQSRPSTRAQAWINNNPRFNADPVFRAKAMAAHYQAEANGVDFESDEYIDMINNAAYGQQPQQVQQQAQQQAQAQVQQKVNYSAPVTRNVVSASSVQQSRPRLTAEQAEIATFLYSNLSAADAQQKYYDNLQRAIKDGRINSGAE